jgi:hypothetical protein
MMRFEWSPEPGLNQRHPVYKTGALPTELSGLLCYVHATFNSKLLKTSKYSLITKSDALPAELRQRGKHHDNKPRDFRKRKPDMKNPPGRRLHCWYLLQADVHTGLRLESPHLRHERDIARSEARRNRQIDLEEN